MRTGKIAAQVAHASMGCVTRLGTYDPTTSTFVADLSDNAAVRQWLFESAFTKIVVSVNSEEELVAIYEAASQDPLVSSCLITDNGKTEFHGVPTKTCVAILGFSDDVDVYTKSLPLM